MALLTVGLGNPGAAYAETRHNAGFLVLDRVAAKLGCTFRRALLRPYLLAKTRYDGELLFLAKPLTYMNRSGEVLRELLTRSGCGVEELLVVCDNLDLPVGVARLKRGGSSAGHNGLASLIHWAGSPDFYRLYIGIGRPASREIIDYVLGVPPETERPGLNASIERAADGVIQLLGRPIERVMNELNQRKGDPSPQG